MLTRALTRRFPTMTNRNFRLLLADRLLAPLAAAFSLVGVSFAVLAATGSTADLSYVIAAQAAPSLVFLLVGGVIADRIAPQLVIVAANVMVAVGEGLFGILVLTAHPSIWVMIVLELVTGTGVALFYPASMALLPRLVPQRQMREASAISRLIMNVAMMAGAALAGECVALFGAGWALAVCGVGMFGTVPLLLAIKVAPLERADLDVESEQVPNMLRDLREGWSEFRSHTWLWATVLQFFVVLAAWCGGFQVLGPAVANAHLGGAAAWGLISAAEATGLIAGGLLALRWSPAPPDAVRRAVGRRDRTRAALAGHGDAAAAVGDLRELVRTRSCHRGDVGGLDGHDGREDPDRQARQGLRLTTGLARRWACRWAPLWPVRSQPVSACPRRSTALPAIMVIASALTLIPRDIRTMRADSVEPVLVPVERVPGGAGAGGACARDGWRPSLTVTPTLAGGSAGRFAGVLKASPGTTVDPLLLLTTARVPRCAFFAAAASGIRLRASLRR